MSAHSPHETLDSCLPYGHFATRKWLMEQGVSRHSLDNAVKSGKLLTLTRGVVARSGLPIKWEGAAGSLDRMLPEPVYVGGLSALVQAGLGHYLAFSERLHLYSPAGAPSWLPKLPLRTELLWHLTTRLWNLPDLIVTDSLREQSVESGWPWRLASPEQAYLEVLAGVPDESGFEHADKLMQGLSALSPKRLDALLRACRHVQVKRLFFFFADRYQYPWRKQLQADDYDLGSGKRSIVQGGRLDKTYLITVPEEFHGPK